MPFLLETKTLEDACALARSLGLAFVELNMNFPECGLERLNAGALKALQKEYGLYFTLHLDEGLDAFAFNPLVRGAWIETARRALRLAVAVDAPVVNMHMPKGVYITLPDRRAYLYEMYHDEYTRAAQTLRALCNAELAGGGTTLAIENTDGFAPHERQAVDALLESPHIRLTLDVGHSFCAKDADMPFYEARPDRLRHMHLHDATGARCHLALGDGELDIAAKLRLARQSGARVVLETKTVAALRASVATLSAML